MKEKKFDYEEVFMGVREQRSNSFFRSFKQDYRLRSLVKNISLNSGKMLDIGCGGGVLTESLPYYFPKAYIYGCDVSKTAIFYAKKLGSGKVTFNIIKNKKLPYKDSFFDVCICFDVMEHVPDVEFFLREIKRVLKKGGKFFLIVPCEGEPFTYTWFFQKTTIGKNLTYRFFGHIHPEFTHQSVVELLKNNGFIVTKKEYSEHMFYQLLHLLTFFVPKLLLECTLGKKKANQYTNSSLISSPGSNKDPLFTIRNLWYAVFDFFMFYPMNWETVLLRRFPYTAWKLHVLATK